MKLREVIYMFLTQFIQGEKYCRSSDNAKQSVDIELSGCGQSSLTTRVRELSTSQICFCLKYLRFLVSTNSSVSSKHLSVQKRSEICSKLLIKTAERCQSKSERFVKIVNSEKLKAINYFWKTLNLRLTSILCFYY